MSEFHFVAARITAAQICRSMGIERGSASVLDSLTSIMLDYLTLLGTTASGAAEGRGAKSADVSDAVLAIVQCGAIKVRPNGDLGDNRDVEELLEWIRGPMQRRMADIARPSKPSSSHYSGSLNAIAPVLPPVNTEADQIAPDRTNLNITGPENIEQPQELVREPTQLNMDPILPKDWLETVATRQSIMNHSGWTPGVSTTIEPDPTIYGP